MNDYRVKFRRGDTGAVVDRRVQAGSAAAARAAVESRGHTVLDVDDARGGVALAEEADDSPPSNYSAPTLGSIAEVVSLLRSIDDRIGRVERSTIVTQPRTTIGWGILCSLLLTGFVLAIVGVVSMLIGLGSAWILPQ